MHSYSTFVAWVTNIHVIPYSIRSIAEGHGPKLKSVWELSDGLWQILLGSHELQIQWAQQRELDQLDATARSFIPRLTLMYNTSARTTYAKAYSQCDTWSGLFKPLSIWILQESWWATFCLLGNHYYEVPNSCVLTCNNMGISIIRLCLHNAFIVKAVEIFSLILFLSL